MTDAKGARIRDLAGESLRWVQPRVFAQEFELQAGETVAGTLAFRSSFGSQATGESGDGCWSFKRLGFISTRVTIRACGRDEDLAVFRNSTWSGGGTLDLPNDRRLQINSNFWHSRYEIRTETDEPLVTFGRVGGILHLSSDIEIHTAAQSYPELPWFVMLGWYLTVMQHRDAVMAAG